MSLFRTLVTLEDPAAPTTSNTTGALIQPGPHRGVESLDFAATDQGVGVYRTSVEVDGQVRATEVVDANGGKCADAVPGNADPYEFVHRVPCKTSVSDAVSFDTRTVSDGTHTLRVRVEDAAGNAATVYSGGFVVDNVPDANTGTTTTPGVPVPGFPNPVPIATGQPNGVNASPLASLLARFTSNRQRTIVAPYGRRIPISGTLIAPGGRPIRGARVDVLTRTATVGSPLVARGTVTTDAAGRYTYVIPPGPSRLVRIGYRAFLGSTAFAQTADVDLQVTGRLDLRPDKRRLRNGQTLAFRGRAYGTATGARKLVELQVKRGKKWMTFATVRTGRGGAVAYRYRFTRTTRPTTYSFRARALQEAGWPYRTGVSKAFAVRVRP